MSSAKIMFFVVNISLRSTVLSKSDLLWGLFLITMTGNTPSPQLHPQG